MSNAVPRLNLIATTRRATGELQLDWQYQNAPEYTSQTRAGLPKTELDEVIGALKTDGWALESQCANPTRDAFTETYTFVKRDA